MKTVSSCRIRLKPQHHKAVTALLMGVLPVAVLSAQNEISMPTEKGTITLVCEDVINNGAFSILEGSIRNDTPNELTSLVFEVAAYDQNGIDVRMCDAFNTGSRCEFHISTSLQPDRKST